VPVEIPYLHKKGFKKSKTEGGGGVPVGETDRNVGAKFICEPAATGFEKLLKKKSSANTPVKGETVKSLKNGTSCHICGQNLKKEGVVGPHPSP